MRIAIVHFSDIHFQDGSNVLTSRVDKIIAAIRPILQDVQGILFAVTGDVAFSGSRQQYQIASDFFARVRTGICAADADMPVYFVFIPGNHDCNFQLSDDVRPALSEALAAKIETIDPSGEIARQMTRVQDDFFSFEAALLGAGAVPRSDRLRYQTRISLGQSVIVFDCYNTAWMSQRDEKQGALLFPTRLLTPEDVDDDGRDLLRIALLHHRDNWLEANNARMLRDYVETYSDVILTGHEHVSSAYSKRKIDGTGPHYLEGAVRIQRTPVTAGSAYWSWIFRWGFRRYRHSAGAGNDTPVMPIANGRGLSAT